MGWSPEERRPFSIGSEASNYHSAMGCVVACFFFAAQNKSNLIARTSGQHMESFKVRFDAALTRRYTAGTRKTRHIRVEICALHTYYKSPAQGSTYILASPITSLQPDSGPHHRHRKNFKLDIYHQGLRKERRNEFNAKYVIILNWRTLNLV